MKRLCGVEHVIVRVGLLVVVLLAASCATSPTAISNAEDPLPTERAPLLVRRGDVVKVEFLYHPELDDTQMVRPDGKIALRMVDEVEVVGLTPQEVRQQLLSLYDGPLKDPEITVVLETDERYVYVGGEVDIPSGEFPVKVPLVDQMTPMEAIIQSGGVLNRTAKLSNVLIIRRIGDKEYARTIDLRGAFKKAERVPLYLQPNDIIYVPRSKIDRADQWVDQYMNRLVPDWINLNLGYAYTRGRTRATGTHTSVTASPGGLTVTRTD